jgi:hypothetical protein
MRALPGDVAITPAGSRETLLPAQAVAAPPVTVQEGASSAAPSKRPLVNPSFHVDLALNLVVLQFVDDKGNVTNSIPSEKQLKAYRDQAVTPGGGTKAT